MGKKHTARRLRAQAEQYRKIGELAAVQPEEVRTRRTAAEQTYTNVLSRLGAEGTYGPQAQAEGPPSGEEQSPEGGVFSQTDIQADLKGPLYHEGLGAAGVKSGGGDIIRGTYKATTLDPEKYQKKVEGSTQFRLMSKLTAEAEQLVNREGPLYDEMINNLQLPIIEGSAAIARENTENLRRAMQRGGAARRNAFESIQRIRSQERRNTQKRQQLSAARYTLDTWSRTNAQDVLRFGQDWASNLGGIREEYQKAMDGAAEMMLTQAMPHMIDAEGRAAGAERAAEAARASMHAAKRAKVGKWLSGIISVGSLAMGGLGALSSFGMLGTAGSGAGAGVDPLGRPSKLQRFGAGLAPKSDELISYGIKQAGAALGSST